MAILATGARVALFGVVACALACCCGAASVGVPCVDSAALDGAAAGVGVVSPALECESRLCLVTKRDAGATALCTVECSSDHDCAGMLNLYCRGGYACATVAGFPRAVCACR